MRTLLLALMSSVITAWLIAGYRRAAGTTLRAPILWAGAALAAILGVELANGPTSSAAASLWRYLAALGSFAPSMALLGAKRPQDRGWQFVVATLWLVAAVPAVQTIVFSPHSRTDLHTAWRWFLWMLIAVGIGNYLPTRFAVPAVLIGAAQVLLLHPVMPRPIIHTDLDLPIVALVTVAVALSWAGVSCWRRGHRAADTDRVWRDFRDAFGAVWALRVMERINQAARQSDRNVRLDWHGFSPNWNPWQRSIDGASDPLQLTLRMLLRRFVSEEWIERRMPAAEPAATCGEQDPPATG